MCLNAVGQNTLAVGVQVAEIVLRKRVSLLRLQAVPPGGMLVVLRDVLAFFRYQVEAFVINAIWHDTE
jgi:hypothetical protein